MGTSKITGAIMPITFSAHEYLNLNEGEKEKFLRYYIERAVSSCLHSVAESKNIESIIPSLFEIHNSKIDVFKGVKIEITISSSFGELFLGGENVC